MLLGLFTCIESDNVVCSNPPLMALKCRDSGRSSTHQAVHASARTSLIPSPFEALTMGRGSVRNLNS